MSSPKDDQQDFFYLNNERQPVGPYSLAELNELAEGEVIKGDTFISAEGWSAWKTWDELQAEQQPAGAVHPQRADPAPLVSGPVLGEACASERSSEMSAHATPEHISPPEVVLRQSPSEKDFPWEVSAELARKAAAYGASGNYMAYHCKCNEFLNHLRKNETFKGLKNAEAEIRVYHDMVGVDLREEKPGCLAQLVMSLPEPVRPLPMFLVGVIDMCLGMSNLIYGLLSLLVAGVVGVLLLVALWFVIIPAVVGAVAVLAVHSVYLQRKLPAIAERIYQNPKSAFAVKHLFKYTPTVPRYWQKADRVGEVVQILRAETSRRLLKRSMIVVVQDNPMENKTGCANMAYGDVVVLSRLLKPERRVFAFSVDGGESVADAAAAAMANMLGVPVTQAEFRFNRFLIK